MKQVLLDELVSIWELLFLSSILNPFATKLSMFVFLVISWRCQCFLLWGAPFFVFYSFTSPACETRNTFFQSFTDRFFVVVLFRASGRMIRTAKKRNREGEWVAHTHTHTQIRAYIEPSIHSSKCCKYLFYNVVCTRVKFATIFYAPNWRRWIEFGNGSRTVFGRVCLFIFGSVLAWI